MVNKEDLKLGQVVLVKLRYDGGEMVGFVKKIAEKRFYIESSSKKIIFVRHWIYYDEVDVEILKESKNEI